MPKNTPEAIIDTPYVTSRRAGSSTTGGSSASSFLALSDTPASYAGSANLVVTVKVTEDGLEFSTAGAVASVNGLTGVVVLDTDDIAEGSNRYYTAERAQDDIGTILVDSSSIDFTYNDGTPSITAAVIDEYIQDLVGLMVSGNTETLITVTYQDSDGTIDFEITDAELTALAGLTSAANKLPYFTGSGTAALADFTAAGRALVDDADATAQRVTLGLVIGTNVQAFDATLLSIAALGTAADKIAYTTGVDTWAETALTSTARSLIDDTSTSAMRTTLGLADEDIQDIIGAFWADSSSIDITYNDPGNSISAAIIDEYVQDVVGAMVSGNTETLITVTYQDSDGTLDFEITDAELTALAGLTSAADKLPYFTGSGTAALADFSAFGRSLVDDAAASNARTTLGLGTMAVEAAADYVLLGGRSTGQRVTGIASTGYALDIYRDLGSASTDSPVARVFQDNAGDDQAAFVVRSDGTGSIFEAYDGATLVLSIPDGGGITTTQGAITFTHSASVINVTRTTSSTTLIRSVAAFLANSSGTVSDGFGPGFFLQLQDATGGPTTVVQFAAVRNGDITSADFVIYTAAAGTLAEVFRATTGGKLLVGVTSAGASVIGGKAGTSSNDFAVGGVLYVDSGTHANTTSGETDLATYTVPADTLAVNNQELVFEAWFTTATGNAKTIKVKFGSDSFTVVNAEVSNGVVVIRGRIIRTGSATQDVFIKSESNYSGSSLLTITTATRTLSGSNILKITGQGTATNDIKQEYFKVWYEDANT